MKLTEAEIMGLKFLLANTKAQVAVLMDRFHVTPETLARLTDRQIDEFYFHRRDKNGAVRPAEVQGAITQAPATLESELAALDALKAQVPLPNFEELKRRLVEKFNRREAEP